MSESTTGIQNNEKKLTMYGSTWCGDCRFARRWLDAHSIAYDYVDIEKNEQAAAYVVQVNNGIRSVPTIIFPDGSVLVEPNARQLVAKFALK